MLADGSVIVGTYIARGFGLPVTTHARFLRSGEVDEDWSYWQNSRSGEIFPLSDGSFLKGNGRYSPEGILLEELNVPIGFSAIHQDGNGAFYFSSGNQLLRWTSEEGVDESFISPLFGDFTRVAGMTVTERGKLLIWGDLKVSGEQRTLLRYHRTGQLDVTFRASRFLRGELAPGDQQLTYGGLRGRAVMTEVFPMNVFARDGAVLVGGSFQSPEASFVLLDDRDVAGYAAWSEATLGEAVPEDGDADGDGASNLEEYAVGSDPGKSDPRRWAVQSAGNGIFEVSCNPEAPEVLRILEVSDDLLNWRTGLSDEVTRETTAGCLRFRLADGRGHLFGRVRYATASQ